MLPSDVVAIVQRIIVAVSAGDYAAALSQIDATHCSEADVLRTLSESGRSFSAPPFAAWDVIPIITGDGVDRWSIRAPLWSEEEGERSDLELFLTASSSDRVAVEFDDIRVA